jgi:hypothetical protein
MKTYEIETQKVKILVGTFCDKCGIELDGEGDTVNIHISSKWSSWHDELGDEEYREFCKPCAKVIIDAINKVGINKPIALYDIEDK